MADIKGIEGVANYLNLIQANNIAVYDTFKQNKLPLIKIEASNTKDLVDKFKEFAINLKPKNYDVIVQKNDTEKLKFSFSNEIESLSANADLLSLQSQIAELKQALSQPAKQTSDLNYIEYKIKCEFLEKENRELEKELTEAEQYISELEVQVQILNEKLKNDDKFLKYYSMFKDKKEPEPNKPVLNDSEKEQVKNEKKEILKNILKFLSANFTNDELKKLLEFVKNKKDFIKSNL